MCHFHLWRGIKGVVKMLETYLKHQNHIIFYLCLSKFLIEIFVCNRKPMSGGSRRVVLCNFQRMFLKFWVKSEKFRNFVSVY
jgi:hypothetical protein